MESGRLGRFVGLNVVNFTIPGFIARTVPLVGIAWRLASAYWGRGFATEAAKAILHYAFIELNLPEVISFTALINQPSRRVMEKIGLQHDEKNDFDHPEIESSSRLCRHVLYHLTRDHYLQKISTP